MFIVKETMQLTILRVWVMAICLEVTQLMLSVIILFISCNTIVWELLNLV
ncbi:hypothetical protein LINPERPRIM_LOCUS5170 [Linum perenne]